MSRLHAPGVVASRGRGCSAPDHCRRVLAWLPDAQRPPAPPANCSHTPPQTVVCFQAACAQHESSPAPQWLLLLGQYIGVTRTGQGADAGVSLKRRGPAGRANATGHPAGSELTAPCCSFQQGTRAPQPPGLMRCPLQCSRPLCVAGSLFSSRQVAHALDRICKPAALSAPAQLQPDPERGAAPARQSGVGIPPGRGAV
jgi:hypothetical protein